MRRSNLRYLFASMLTMLLVFGTSSAHACAVCFGKSDSQLAKGMNWGVAALLLVVFFVLSTISVFFIYLAKRSAKFSGITASAVEPETTQKVS